ncbi:MAG TPA: PAS domain S-box protein, partial [Anaerolineae bacterium]|nr:PAS domain S-box protein [Anaerolineae bacterium]
ESIILLEDRSIWAGHPHCMANPILKERTEFRIRRKDGQVRWIEHACRTVTDEQGNFWGFRSSNRNFTERKLAEEALQIKDQAIASSINGIALADLQGHLTYVNQAFLETWGYSTDTEVLGRVATSFWQSEAEAAKVAASLHTQGRWHGELVGRRKDGSLFEAQLSANLIVDANRNPIGMMAAFVDVTAHKQAIAALADSEKKYRTLFENANDAIYLADPVSGRILDCNQRAASMLGYSVVELKQKHITDFHPPAEVERALMEFKAAARANSGITLLGFRHQHRDGGLVPVEINTGLINLDQQPLVLGMVRDMTERVAGEEALKRSQQELRLTLEATTDGIWSWHFPTDQMEFSPRYYTMLGYEPGEFPASFECWQDLLHPTDRACAVALMRDWLQTKTDTYTNDFRLRTKSGDYRWIYPIGRVVEWDASGQAIRMIGNHQDITERKQAEARLQEYAQRLSLATKSAGIGIWEWDISTDILIWDEQMYKLYGLSPEEFDSRYEVWAKHLHPDDLAAVMAAVQRAVAAEQEFHPQFRVIWPDGQIRFIEGHALVQRNAAGTPLRMIGVNWDITAGVHLTQENEQLQKQFYQAQKMESIGLLAGGIAHDFNNLLVPIIGYADMGLAATPKEHKLYGSLLQIKQAGERAADLTRQILAFSRQQMLEMRILDLNTVITDFKKMLQRLIGEDVLLYTELADSLYPIKGDQGQLEQVLLNLAVNARDAMPTGGKLTIETTNVWLDEANTAKFPDLRPGPYVSFTVSDTGSGMDPETQERIFEPFFTTKVRGRGTGLGLATVFGIIKQHEGNISVSSQLQHGTTFEIHLPAAETPRLAETSVPQKTATTPGSETVLVVEDEINVRQFVSYSLQSFGYHVLEADGPQQGLSLATSHPGIIDLLLTDVVMPDMDGPELYRVLAQTRPTMQVLYMSGYTDDVMRQHSLLDHDLALLPKPFSMQELLNQVQAALSKAVL